MFRFSQQLTQSVGKIQHSPGSRKASALPSADGNFKGNSTLPRANRAKVCGGKGGREGERELLSDKIHPMFGGARDRPVDFPSYIRSMEVEDW